MTDVVSPAEAAGTDVARVLTDAFLDDPGWRDVGPERELHRRLVMWGYHRALQRKALRWGRPGYAAFRDGQLVGVAVTFDHEAWPPPEPISTLLGSSQHKAEKYISATESSQRPQPALAG